MFFTRKPETTDAGYSKWVFSDFPLELKECLRLPHLEIMMNHSDSQSSNNLISNCTAMSGTVNIEIVGLKNSECSPFPCDENRTCGLTGCYLKGRLTDAFAELEKVLKQKYGERVSLNLTIIEGKAPDHIREIVEREFPPMPMVIVNGQVTKIGRIALDRIKTEIEKEL